MNDILAKGLIFITDDIPCLEVSSVLNRLLPLPLEPLGCCPLRPIKMPWQSFCSTMLSMQLEETSFESSCPCCHCDELLAFSGVWLHGAIQMGFCLFDLVPQCRSVPTRSSQSSQISTSLVVEVLEVLDEPYLHLKLIVIVRLPKLAVHLV
jgi:hypothetical protein